MLASFTQPTVVTAVCRQLTELRDVLSLARCNRLLYARITTCFPELVTIRTLLPTRGWQLTMAELLKQRQHQSLVVWRTCFYAAIRCAHLQDDSIVTLLFACERWGLLQMLVDCVQSWKRIVLGGVYEIPEIQRLWADIAMEAVRRDNEEWLKQASSALAHYYEVYGRFCSEWLVAAGHDLHEMTLWASYRAWYVHVFLPAFRKEAKRVQEEKNVAFLRQLLIEHGRKK